MKYLFALFLLICSHNVLCAQQVFSKPMPFFGQLSSNEIVDIHQDREGYIWLGTSQGLERYDGYGLQTFKSNYRNPTLLLHNAITCIADDERHVWIGTQQGLNLFEKTSCRIFPFPGNLFQGQPIRYMVADKADRMWIASGKKMVLCDRNLSVIREYDFSSFVSPECGKDLGINSIYPDPAGNLWVLTWRGGLFKYLPEKDSFVGYPPLGTANNPFAMYQDRTGRYWIATWGDGLWSFFPEKPTGRCYVKQEVVNQRGGFPEPIFYSLTQDDFEGLLWALSYNELYVFKVDSAGGLKRVDIRDVVDPYKMYTKILKDKEGNLWLGSYDRAYTVFFSRTKIENYSLPQLKKHLGWDPNLVDLCLDKSGMLWINQDRYGLCLYDLSKGQAGYKDRNGSAPPVKTGTLAPSTRKEGIWAGDRYAPHVMRLKHNGLKIQVEETLKLETIRPDPGVVNQLLEDRKGNLWMLTSTHLFVRAAKGNVFVYDEKKPPVNRLTRDREGAVWAFSSDRQICRLDCTSEGFSTVSSVRIPLLLENEQVERLCLDGNGCIWWSTSLGRVGKSDREKRNFEQVDWEDLSGNTSVLNLLADDQYVWFVTNSRILRYDIRRKETKKFATTDGNISVSIFRNEASYLDAKGRLYAGGHGGFVCIQPEKGKGPKVPPPHWVVTDVKVGNRSLFFSEESSNDTGGNTLQKVILRPKDRNLEILFSSLSYFPNRDTQCAYKLEGVDRDWVYPDKDKHAAYYNRIGKGTHSFWLKSTDEEGRWGKEIRLITVQKLPAFYETWYACLGYVGVVAFLVYGVSRIYLRHVRKKHAAKLQEELVRTKLDYFTHISHELLTPLTVISCATDYLAGNASSSGKMIAALRSNVDRLKRLLQQMLDFRKVEHGKMILKVRQGNIRTFIQDTCTSHFMPLARKKGISLCVEMNDEEIGGYLDFDKLDTMLYNLISNAVKYTPEGKQVRVVLQTEHRDAHRFLVIRVEDEGPGIAPKEQERIFEQFYVNQSKTPAASNGIGLSLTKALVRLHHGTICVKSDGEKGACFVIELPLDKDCYSEAERVEDRPEVEDRPAERPMPDETVEKSCVLLVEDNAELLELMKEVFARRYTVWTGANGLQAWDVLENQPVDVVVSDVMMPEMNGWELCRKIKSDLRFSHIPVIILTAKSGMDDRVASYEAGADGYLAKPFEGEVLFARIDNLIKSYRMRQRVFQKEDHVDLDGLQYKPADRHFLQEVVDRIETHLSESDFDLDQLASDLSLSKSTLYRKIKGMTGLTPLDLVRNVKLKRACTLLEEGRLTISEIAYSVGFSNPKYFTKCFKEEFGTTPSEYQHRHFS